MDKAVKVEESCETDPIQTISPPVTPSTSTNGIPRGAANRKERKRTLTMNSAFAQLRDHIPNVPPDTKLSKIKTLRLAISYIKFLTEILEESNEGKGVRSHHNFPADTTLRAEGREKRKRESTPPLSETSQSRKRGRTGWPQHVWAMELRN